MFWRTRLHVITWVQADLAVLSRLQARSWSRFSPKLKAADWSWSWERIFQPVGSRTPRTGMCAFHPWEYFPICVGAAAQIFFSSSSTWKSNFTYQVIYKESMLKGFLKGFKHKRCHMRRFSRLVRHTSAAGVCARWPGVARHRRVPLSNVGCAAQYGLLWHSMDQHSMALVRPEQRDSTV